MRETVLTLTAAATALAVPHTPAMRGTASFQVSVPPADSVEILEHAQGRQRRFELSRREHLPWTYSSSGRCDIRIGRYCFRFDDDQPAWRPPPEHEDVLDARDELIAVLDSAWRAVRGDPWITTQLIRYLTEADLSERAYDVAARCEATPLWLCDALKGYTAYQLREYRSAERAFDRALYGMPEKQRCDWEDISDLITGDLRGRVRSLECLGDRAVIDTIFWLADPLYTVPGNELRAEHFARHVVSLMQRQAKGPDPDGWNSSVHRITIRYGEPRGWQRIRGSPSELRVSLVTHYGTDGAASFFPSEEYVDAPYDIPIGEWTLDDERPQANHDPPYATNGFGQMSARFALFRAGDSTAIVATGSFSHDSLMADVERDFALITTSGPAREPEGSFKTVRDSSITLTITRPARPHLVSFEIVSFAQQIAARARQGLDLTRVHGPGLVASDILVLDALDSVPQRLIEAIPHVRESTSFRPGEQFTLYWEVYGLKPGSSLHSTTISLDKVSKGIFRRIAELTPFASHDPAVHVTWEEAAQRDESTERRALVIDLPDELSGGDYELTLSVETPAGQITRRVVELTVRD